MAALNGTGWTSLHTAQLLIDAIKNASKDPLMKASKRDGGRCGKERRGMGKGRGGGRGKGKEKGNDGKGGEGGEGDKEDVASAAVLEGQFVAVEDRCFQPNPADHLYTPPQPPSPRSSQVSCKYYLYTESHALRHLLPAARHHPTNPPTHQPTNPPTHQPTNPPTHQLANRSRTHRRAWPT